MVVHAHQSGQCGVTCHVHAVRIRRDRHCSCIADGRDLSARDHNGLVSLGRRASSINHAHVLQRDYWRLHADEIFGRGLRLWLGEARGTANDQKSGE